MVTITSNSPEETYQIGVQWAKELEPGWILGLEGDLGAGKTQLVKGLTEGWNVEQRISSPTFTLIHEYQGEHGTVYHLDLYRLDSQDAIWDAGIAEYLNTPVSGWVVVEWVERWTREPFQHRTREPEVNKPFRWVHIEGGENHTRSIRYEDFRD